METEPQDVSMTELKDCAVRLMRDGRWCEHELDGLIARIHSLGRREMYRTIREAVRDSKYVTAVSQGQAFQLLDEIEKTLT